MKQSLIILLSLALFFIFADFFAPYSASAHQEAYAARPPMRIHLRHQGQWHSPFVYDALGQPVSLKLFTRGDSYKILGIFRGNLHLFGTQNNQGMLALLGTDAFGRDVFSRLILGSRVSLLIAFGASLFSVFLSFYAGVLSALHIKADKMIQFIAEMLKTIPRILLIMVLARMIPASASVLSRCCALILILSSTGWMYWAKIIRTLAYQAMQQEYILCARTFGAGSADIITMHLRPLLKNYFRTAFINTLPLMLISEAMLSFLGVGIQEPFVSWGLMLNQLDSASNLMQMPWLVSSALAVVLSVLLLHHWANSVQKEEKAW